MFGKNEKSTRRIRLPFESKDEKPYILSRCVEIGEGALNDVDLVRCHEGGEVWEYCEEACVDCEPI